MTSPKSLVRRKAAKAVAVHTARGSISKVRRQPARATSLISLGAVLGSALGYVLGRRTSAPASPATPATSAHGGSTIQQEPVKTAATAMPAVGTPT